MPTEMVGMRPARAVVTNRPIVVRGLASQTRRRDSGVPPRRARSVGANPTRQPRAAPPAPSAVAPPNGEEEEDLTPPPDAELAPEPGA